MIREEAVGALHHQGVHAASGQVDTEGETGRTGAHDQNIHDNPP